MDYFQKLHKDTRYLLIALLVIGNILALGSTWIIYSLFGIPLLIALVISLCIATVAIMLSIKPIVGYVLSPLEVVWQNITQLSSPELSSQTSNLESLKIGRELVENLMAQVRQLTNSANETADKNRQEQRDVNRNFVAQNLPQPLFIVDNSETIIFANKSASEYVGIDTASMIGKNIYMVLDMSFPDENTLDKWLKGVKYKKATATSSWERVRLNLSDNHPVRLFDLAAYYNHGNPDKIETIITLFDHTKEYSQDEQAISFIALSVHELRTPLTLLRGYIEVLEDEFTDDSNEELQDFMLKMRSQSDQLMAFVNNILNVARVDSDQLELQLDEQQWGTILKSAVQSLSLRAKVRGITIHCRIATNLPTVGVDRLSIYEVINNLVDNAIKYSGTSKIIEIDTHLTEEGLVETTIKDYGLGITSNILPNLFSKFYRDHHNRAQVGGTGLGLYLSKAIVTAHGGSIWVRSKEGEGSTFAFTLVPYAKLTEDLKNTGDDSLTRGAHGWIKNHSLYRK